MQTVSSKSFLWHRHSCADVLDRKRPPWTAPLLRAVLPYKNQN